MYRLIFITLLTTIFLACKPTAEFTYSKFSDSLSKYRTTKLIELDTIKEPHKNYLEFENRNSVISISTDKFIDYALKRIHDSICNPKKMALNEMLEILDHSKNNHYFIESEISPEDYKKWRFDKPRKYEKRFIEPFGYQCIIDTVGKSRMTEFKYWIVSELCISGKCLVLDKRKAAYVDSIYYEIIDFNDGHGGESLDFADKKPFFNVKVYSDIAWPDFDCMTKAEIEEWNKK